MRRSQVSLILCALAAASMTALPALARADASGQGKGPKWDRHHDGDEGRDSKGKSKHTKNPQHADHGERGDKYWHKSKKHRYHAAVYKPGGGPPPWAPAWGYRRKQSEQGWYPASYPSPFPGYEPNSYRPPFGIGAGRCDRIALGDTIGTAVGSAGGNFLQTRGADGQVAALAGLVVGAMVSDKIARNMDRVDQTCIGQILEHAPDGRTVNWSQAGGPRYDVVPLTTYGTSGGGYCREYRTTTTIAGVVYSERGLACRQPSGAWKVP